MVWRTVAIGFVGAASVTLGCSTESGDPSGAGASAGSSSAAGVGSVAGASSGTAGTSSGAAGSGGSVAGSSGMGGASGGTAGAFGGAAAGSAGSGAAGAASQVTWAEDVAPIVYSQCVGCHRAGGIAPFPLTGYDLAWRSSDVLAEITAARVMPPMPVDNSGSCNTYSNARWLTDDEIAIFAAWHAAGAPPGDLTKEPPLPAPPPGLDRVDVTLDPGEAYTPNDTLADDYRCFLVDPGTTEDAYVVAYDVIPGDDRVVHHAIVYEPATDEDTLAAEDLDAAEAGLGYTCFGAPRVDATPVAIWAPGGSAVTLPQGTGLALAPRKLVLQVHYNLAAGAFPDRTVVRFKTEPTVGLPGLYQPIADPDTLMVLPGQENIVSTQIIPVNPPVPSATVYGVAPHMHTLGRTLRLDAQFGSRDQCLVNVDRWDFHWQNTWWYDTPMRATSVSEFTLSCGYDTSDRTEVVTWGEGTRDEMCLVYLYVTL